MLRDKHKREILSSVPQTELGDRITSLNFSSVDSHEIPRLMNWGNTSKWKQRNVGDGWMVSGVDPKDGQPTMLGVQVKTDTPTTGSDGKPVKYLSALGYPSEPIFLDTGDSDYWKTVQSEPFQWRWLVEGAKKSASLMALGQPAISLPGVDNWGVKGTIKGRLLPFIKGARVALCFDMDWQMGKDGKPNLNVLKAVTRLAREVITKGGIPVIVHWEVTKGKGIDDFLMQVPESDREMVIEGLLEQSWNLQQFLDNTKSLDQSKDDDGLKPKLVKDYELIKKSLGDRIRFNELRQVIEIDGQEIDLGYARRDLMIDHGLLVKSSDSDVAGVTLKAAKNNSYHPVRDYLDAVAEEYGSDYSILTNIAERYFGASEPIYTFFVIRFLIGAVARIYEPGCKFDCALILQGNQGDFKSTWFKTLAGPSWFDDSLGDMTDKDEKLKMHRVWFSEWAELESVFKRKDVATVKSILSSSVDQLRPPYARSVQDFPRRSVIVGSTNEDEFLADSTGNRRYWVVPVSRRIPLELLDRERDQIWAAAVALYRANEQWWLTDGEDRWQLKSVAQFQSDEIWSTTIAKWVANPKERETGATFDYITTQRILLHAVGQELERLDRAMQMRVADTMKRLGWKSVQKRIDSTNQRIWIPTKKWTDSQSEVDAFQSYQGFEGNPTPSVTQPGFEVDALKTLTTARLYQLYQPHQPNKGIGENTGSNSSSEEIEKGSARKDFPATGCCVDTNQSGQGLGVHQPFFGVGERVGEVDTNQSEQGFGEIPTSKPDIAFPLGSRILFPAPGTTQLIEGVVDQIRVNPIYPDRLQYHCQNGSQDDWCEVTDLQRRE